MSSAWYCIPSKRPPAEAIPNLARWRDMGYEVLLQRDPGEGAVADFRTVERPYAGYAEAVNHLTRIALDEGAGWIVTGGDDMTPDPNKRAEEIAAECIDHFRFGKGCPTSDDGTWGVMQPTGDRWLVNGPGTKPGSECVAGSPWMGREWCLRINQGRGPLWPEYFHCGEDEELMEVAIKYGVFWQRPDLTHFHNHWGRPREGERMGLASRMPEFLTRANSREEWQKMKKLLAERKAAGWPGTEPIL